MNLQIGKQYKIKNFYEATGARVLENTKYEIDEVTVLVERIDTDNDYCLVIIDGDKTITNPNGLGKRNFFVGASHEEWGIEFTEVTEA